MAADIRRLAARPRWRNDLGLIGLSLLLGFLVWFIARNRTFETKTVPIAVRPVGVPANVEIDIPSEEVELRVSLPANLSDIVRGNDFEVQVDMSGIARNAGIQGFQEFTIPLYLTDVQESRELGISSGEIVPEAIFPRQLTMRARLITSSFDLHAKIVGKPAEGFHVQGEPEVRPRRVWLTSSRSSIEKATSEGMVLQTDPIDIAGRQAGRLTFSPGISVPQGFRIVGYQDTASSEFKVAQEDLIPATDRLVTIDVVEDRIQRSISNVGGRLPLLRRDLVVTEQTPQTFTVTVSGPRSIIDHLEPQDFTISAPTLLNFDQPVEGLEVRVEAALSRDQTDDVRQSVVIDAVEPNRATVTIEAAAPTTPPATTPAPAAPPLIAPQLPPTVAPQMPVSPESAGVAP
jgi:hypothetical protein